MGLTIHTAQSIDALDVAAVHNQCVRTDYKGHIPGKYIDVPVGERRVEAWRGWICRSRVSTVLARINSELVGFSTLQPNNDGLSPPHSVELIGVYVLRNYWGQGIGRSLFERILEKARNSDFTEMVYWEIESNAKGKEFYKSLRFKDDGNRRTFLEESNQAIEEVRFSRPI